MFKTIKKWWQQHLKEVEEYRKEDLQQKYLEPKSSPISNGIFIRYHSFFLDALHREIS